MALDNATIVKILQAALQNRASDIHLRAGVPPAFRVHHGLLPIQFPAFSDEDMLLACKLITGEDRKIDNWDQIRDIDGSFSVDGVGRFRYNIFRNQKQLGAVLRAIPGKVPTIEELGLPPILKTIAEYPRGLILVTGATGSGKSSTLAAMINEINTNQASHILTIEDPIEYVHPVKKARITQREVGSDTDSFAKALRSALRQDPDVILVGEMRDIETLDVALKASETGHAVFSTVHTTDAIKTIGRLIAMYPAAEQQMVRLRLSENLKSTISQRLINRADGKGKVVAMEIMIANHAIQECIANPQKTCEMNYYIEVARERLQSQTFDQHLGELYKAGTISLEIAMEAASNPADFERNLMFGDKAGKTASDSDDEPKSDLEVEADVPEETSNEPEIEHYGGGGGSQNVPPAKPLARPTAPPAPPAPPPTNFSTSELRAKQQKKPA
jgi:twitching motility protein PilT